MSVPELKKYIVKSKYARHNKGQRRRENYSEAVDRVMQMMLDKYPMARGLINDAYDEVQKETALGSQRAMQFGGRPTFQHNARLYNCTCSYADRLRFFQEAFYLLLCGCGVGFSVQKHHVAALPKFHRPFPFPPANLRYDFPVGGDVVESVWLGNESKVWRDPEDRTPPAFTGTFNRLVTYVIPDTIEGWADALGVLLSSYFEDGPFPEYLGKRVSFDFSLIRPKGSYLSSGAGKAPGPEPLKRALEKIEGLLDRCLAAGQEGLRPIDVYDIVMHASDAVLAGGVRRSASICVFSPDDDEMARAKLGNWLQENPQRARSNNSALLVRGATTLEEFAGLMEHVKVWGEPGFVWADSTEFLVNPCVEIGMWPSLRLGDPALRDSILRDYKGPIGYDSQDMVPRVSGWQFCNLTTINGSLVKTRDDFYRACWVAAVLGTLQAGFSDFPYLGPITEGIVRAEALLGVSITSIMSNPGVMLDPNVLSAGAQIVLETNAYVAKLIGINPCARATCIKPEGTSTLMLGSLASGVHGWPFKKGIRNVQANTTETVYQWFREHNPGACERSVWCANGSTDVISFPIEAPDTARLQSEFTAIEFLEMVKTIYLNWVVPGKRPERCTQQWLHHSVSNTVKVRPDEWDAVTRHIYDNREYYAGISLLPASGDKDYEQAPNVAVYTPDEIEAEYGHGAYYAAFGVVDGHDAHFDKVWDVCNAMLGFRETSRAESAWIGRATARLMEIVGGDAKRATHAIKDVYYWLRYESLCDSFADVDYDGLIEENDETTPQAEVACAGGACSLM